MIADPCESSMSQEWYCTRDDVTRGPFSEEEIKDQFNRKLLLESDWLWRDRGGRKDAVLAASFLDSQSSQARSAIPDWLGDVAMAESTGPQPAPVASDQTPEWLEDLRLWIALDLCVPGRQASDPTLVGTIPDWLRAWLIPDKPKARHSPAVPVMPVDAPVSSPHSGTPTMSPERARPAGLQVGRSSSPAETIASSSLPTSPLVENVRQESGFDLETGQILDPEKFAKWKQQQAQSSSTGQLAVSNASLFEVFRKARIAIEAWVDNEANRACMMKASPEEIRERSDIQAIFHEYAAYGEDMEKKLARHLEFMVENRRSYYKAVNG